MDAGEETRHEVVCCSDVPVSGWAACNGGTVWAERNGGLFLGAKVALGFGDAATTFNGTGDPTVAGGAFQWSGGDGCVHNAPWDLAAEICHTIVVDSANGYRARLCTSAEILEPSLCGKGTGCGHDADMLW